MQWNEAALQTQNNHVLSCTGRNTTRLAFVITFLAYKNSGLRVRVFTIRSWTKSPSSVCLSLQWRIFSLKYGQLKHFGLFPRRFFFVFKGFEKGPACVQIKTTRITTRGSTFQTKRSEKYQGHAIYGIVTVYRAVTVYGRDSIWRDSLQLRKAIFFTLPVVNDHERVKHVRWGRSEIRFGALHSKLLVPTCFAISTMGRNKMALAGHPDHAKLVYFTCMHLGGGGGGGSGRGKTVFLCPLGITPLSLHAHSHVRARARTHARSHTQRARTHTHTRTHIARTHARTHNTVPRSQAGACSPCSVRSQVPMVSYGSTSFQKGALKKLHQQPQKRDFFVAVGANCFSTPPCSSHKFTNPAVSFTWWRSVSASVLLEAFLRTVANMLAFSGPWGVLQEISV